MSADDLQMSRPRLLLVDADLNGARVMESGLSKDGFSVTIATDAKQAWGCIEQSPPDLVLCDAKIPGDGAELCRSLKSNERFREIPFVLLSADSPAQLSQTASGADAHLVKPIYLKEVIGRLRILLGKTRMEKVERREGKAGFSGSLADMGVVDLVQAFEIGRKTGILHIRADRSGTLYFRDGKVIDAELGRARGEGAFYRMLQNGDGVFEVQFAPIERAEVISFSTQALLLEGMRRLDEWNRILSRLPSSDAVFELDPRRLVERLAEIPDEVNPLLRLFNGKRNLFALVEECDFDDLESLQIISKLFFEGLIREIGSAPLEELSQQGSAPDWLKSPLPAAAGADDGDEPTLPSIPAPQDACGGPMAQVIKFPPKPRAVDAHSSREPAQSTPVSGSLAMTPHPSVSLTPALGTPSLAVADAMPVAGTRVATAPQATPGLGTPSLPAPALDTAAPDALHATPTLGMPVAELRATPALGTPSLAAARAAPAIAASQPALHAMPSLDAVEPLPIETGSGTTSSPALVEPVPCTTPALAAVAPAPLPLAPPEVSQPHPREALLRTPALGLPAFLPPADESAGLPTTRSEEPLKVAARADGGKKPASNGRAEIGVLRPPKPREPEVVTAEVPPPLAARRLTARKRLGISLALAGIFIAVFALIPHGKKRSATPNASPPAAEAPRVAPAVAAAAKVATPPAAPFPTQTERSGAEAAEPAHTAVATPPDATKPGKAGETSPQAAYSKHLWLGQRALDRERFRLAAAQFRRALKYRPDSNEAKAGLGIALVRSDPAVAGYAEAVKVLEEALQTDRANAQGWLALGMAYQFSRRDDRAVMAYKKFLELDPKGSSSSEVRAMLQQLER